MDKSKTLKPIISPMQIYQGAPVGGAVSGLMVQKPISHLVITSESVQAATLMNMKLTIKLTKGTNTQEVCQEIKLSSLAAAVGHVDGLGLYIDADGTHTFIVALSRDGGLAAQNGSYIKIDLADAPSVEFTLSGYETATGDGKIINYRPFTMLTDQQKYSNEGFEYLILPKTDLKLLKLNYPNDGNPEYGYRELVAHDMINGGLAALSETTARAWNEQAIDDNSDITANIADISLMDLSVIDITGVVSFELQKEAGSQYTFVAVDWKR